MADLDLEEYQSVEATSELLHRPGQHYAKVGPAAFVSLCVKLGVPVMNSVKNSFIATTPQALGYGASSLVSAFERSLELDIRGDLANRGAGFWFKDLVENHQGSLTNLRFVAKRINSGSTSGQQGRNHLAAIANEVRILSNRAIRSSNNIVSLLAVSWYEEPLQGRFWPQLFLQQADLGTLDKFLSGHAVERRTKYVLYRDILDGLQCLHSQGVVHCDLKPQNILIVRNTSRGVQSGVEPFWAWALKNSFGLSVVARICDFGFSVITTDYGSSRPFKACVGTWPWMSPEMEAENPIPLELLYKSDIYTCGLLLASIFLNGCCPLAGSDIHELKTSNEITEYLSLRVFGFCELAENAETRFVAIWVQTLSADPSERLSINELINEWNISIRECFVDEYQFSEDDSTILLRTRYATETVVSSIGIPSFEQPKSLQTLADSEETNNRLQIYAADIAVPMIPDLCFETYLQPWFLPRVARDEVIADLNDQLKINEDPNVLFVMSGVYINGSIVEKDPTEGLRLLTEAARKGHPEAINYLPIIRKAILKSTIGDFDQSWATNIHTNAKIHLTASLTNGALDVALEKTDKYHQRCSIIHIWKRYFPRDYYGWIESLERVEYVYLMLQTFLEAENKMNVASVSFSATPKPEKPESPGFSRLQNMTLRPHHYNRQDISMLLRSKLLNLDDCGLTPGWTPLWLSVISGGSVIMNDLIEHGCSPKKNSSSGAGSVLHALNQLCAADVRPLLKKIMPNEGQVSSHHVFHFSKMFKTGSNELHIEDRVNDLTPLLATFVAWDYSDGEAARALLAYGANPTASTEFEGLDTTPIVLCMRNLDYELLSCMLSSPWALNNNNKHGRSAIAATKVNAFRYLLSRTEFSYVCTLGENFQHALKRCLELLIDDEMREHLSFENTDLQPSMHASPLSSALYNSKDFIAEALLELYGAENLLVSAKETPLLLTAIERRHRKIAVALIREGASLIQTGLYDYNAFHTAAHHFPAFLPELIALAEETKLCESSGKTMKEVLQIPTELGLDVMSLLLLEGHEEQFPIAKELLKYDLDLDNHKYDVGKGTLWTLAALAVYQTARGAITPRTQLDFILNMEPKPKFICSSEDDTLLTVAMLGVKPGSEFVFPEPKNMWELIQLEETASASSPAIHVIRMLLSHYPEIEHLTTPAKKSPIMTAAKAGLTTVLHLFENHVKSKEPEMIDGLNLQFFKLLSLPISANGNHVLDSAWMHYRILAQEIEEVDEIDEIHEKQSLDAIDHFKYLRERGALMTYGRQQEGYILKREMLYDTLVDQQAFFMGASRIGGILAKAAGLTCTMIRELPNPIVFDHDKADEAVARQIEANPDLEDSYCYFRFLSLTWIFDRFHLQIGTIQCSPLRLGEWLETGSSEQIQETLAMAYYNLQWDNPGKVPPWGISDYAELIPGCNTRYTWRRESGMLWSSNDIARLSALFTEAWQDEFKEAIEKTERLGEGKYPVIFRQREPPAGDNVFREIFI